MHVAYGDGVRHRSGLFGAMRRFWWVVVAATALAATSGYLVSGTRSERYRSTSRLLLAAPDEASVFRGRAGSGSPERRLANEVERVESVDVATRAAKSLGNALSPEAIRRRIDAEGQPARDVIVITGTGVSAAEAAAVTNAVAEAYRDLRRELGQAHAAQAAASLDQYAKELSATIAGADARLQEIRKRFEAEVSYLTGEDRVEAVVARMQADVETRRLENERSAAQDALIQVRTEAQQIATDAALNDAGVTLYERAEEPSSPASPKPARDAALAGVLGLVAAAAWVWTRAERMSERVDGHDAAVVLGAPLLADIPTMAPVGIEVLVPPVRPGRRSVYGSEPFQLAMASLQFALAQSGARTVMVTSPGPGDGKSFVAFNLAAAAARDGRKVVLVDADLRARHLSQELRLDTTAGLGELVHADDPDRVRPCPLTLKDGHRLGVVPAGSFTSAAEVLDGTGLERAFRHLEAGADLVVVDSPPVLAVGDASTIAGRVGGTVVVIPAGSEARVVEETRWRLVLTGTPVLGCVVNNPPHQPRGLPWRRGADDEVAGADRVPERSRSTARDREPTPATVPVVAVAEASAARPPSREAGAWPAVYGPSVASGPGPQQHGQDNRRGNRPGSRGSRWDRRRS